MVAIVVTHKRKFILLPLLALFAHPINDLPNNIRVSSVAYADDSSLFASNNNLIDLCRALESAESDALERFPSKKLLCRP